MSNHPNRGWRSRWSVDLESSTASHRDGWAFKFSQVAGFPGVYDGECINQPVPMTRDHLAQAARVAREAGEIYVEYRKLRQ